jgi:hypothetical protein
MLKIMRTVSCAKISNQLNNMLLNRFFQVFLGNQSNRWCRLNNGSPLDNVLAPILFNLYMSDSDLPSSSLNLFLYAADIALTHRARKIEKRFVLDHSHSQIYPTSMAASAEQHRATVH